MKVEYDEINGKDTISEELKQILGSYISEELEFARKVQIRTVQSPFILPDNFFDLGEGNNTTEVYNVKEVRMVTFTGGNMFTEYVKDGEDAYIVQGNSEEGYNVFNLI